MVIFFRLDEVQIHKSAQTFSPQVHPQPFLNFLANWIYELSGVMFSIYTDRPCFLIDMQK